MVGAMDNKLVASVSIKEQRLSRRQIRGCHKTITMHGKRVSIHQGEAKTYARCLVQLSRQHARGDAQNIRGLLAALRNMERRLNMVDAVAAVGEDGLKGVVEAESLEQAKHIARRVLDIIQDFDKDLGSDLLQDEQ